MGWKQHEELCCFWPGCHSCYVGNGPKRFSVELKKNKHLVWSLMAKPQACASGLFRNLFFLGCQYLTGNSIHFHCQCTQLLGFLFFCITTTKKIFLLFFISWSSSSKQIQQNVLGTIVRKVRRILEASYFAFFRCASLEKQLKTFRFFFEIKCLFPEIHEKQSWKWGTSFFGSDFLYLSSHTNMQFPQIREKTLCSLAEPSPTCFWGNLAISLARKLPRQQEEKRPERAKKRVFKRRIYKGKVSLQQPGQKRAGSGGLTSHRSGRQGGRSSIKCQRCRPGRGVGGWVGGSVMRTDWFFSFLVRQYRSQACSPSFMTPNGMGLKIPKKFHTPTSVRPGTVNGLCPVNAPCWCALIPAVNYLTLLSLFNHKYHVLLFYYEKIRRVEVCAVI